MFLLLPLPVRLANFARPKAGQKMLPIVPFFTLSRHNNLDKLRTADFLSIDEMFCPASLAESIVCFLFSYGFCPMGLIEIELGDVEDTKAEVARKQVFRDEEGVVVFGHQQYVCSIIRVFCFDLLGRNEATIRAVNHAEASKIWLKNGRSFVYIPVALVFHVGNDNELDLGWKRNQIRKRVTFWFRNGGLLYLWSHRGSGLLLLRCTRYVIIDRLICSGG